ncbi:hypothetical protein NMY22_g2576 [Coprinellus aureogranulatus]|nr:hypothetical protein NMY22_g2576 [Coprinellus aureogranulatus]
MDTQSPAKVDAALSTPISEYKFEALLFSSIDSNLAVPLSLVCNAFLVWLDDSSIRFSQSPPPRVDVKSHHEPRVRRDSRASRSSIHRSSSMVFRGLPPIRRMPSLQVPSLTDISNPHNIPNSRSLNKISETEATSFKLKLPLTLVHPNSPYVPWEPPVRQRILCTFPVSGSEESSEDDDAEGSGSEDRSHEGTPRDKKPLSSVWKAFKAAPKKVKTKCRRLLGTRGRDALDLAGLGATGTDPRISPEKNVIEGDSEAGALEEDQSQHISYLPQHHSGIPLSPTASFRSAETHSLAIWLAERQRKFLDKDCESAKLMSLDEYERAGSWIRKKGDHLPLFMASRTSYQCSFVSDHGDTVSGVFKVFGSDGDLEHLSVGSPLLESSNACPRTSSPTASRTAFGPKRIMEEDRLSRIVHRASMLSRHVHDDYYSPPRRPAFSVYAHTLQLTHTVLSLSTRELGQHLANIAMDVPHGPSNNTPRTRLVNRNPDEPLPRFFLLLNAPWKEDKDMAKDLKSRASENAMPMVPQKITSNIAVSATQAARTWHPSGAWKWTAGLCIRGCSNIMNLSSTQKKAVRTYFGTGTIGTQEIEYICKSWQLKPDMPDFVNEISLFKGQLAALQGIYVPNIIGIYSGVYSGIDVVNMLMELAHPAFWMHASDDMPDVLKKRCIECFERIHAAGVLYGKVQLSNIIVGADARVTLVNFQHAAVLDPLPESIQKRTTPDKLRLEMRQVKYLLDYDEARSKEHQKWIGFKARKEWNEKEYQRAKAESEYAPQYLCEPEEDMLNPPVDPRRTKGWTDSRHKSARFVVPTITPEFFDNAVEKFIANIHRLEDESDGLPRSPRPSPPPDSPPSQPCAIMHHLPTSQMPSELAMQVFSSGPVVRRGETPLRRSPRNKRKAREDNAIESPIAKRQKLEKPATLYKSPSPSKPIRLRDFMAGSSRGPFSRKAKITQALVELNPDPPPGVRGRPSKLPLPVCVMEPRPPIARRKRSSKKALGKRKRSENEEVPARTLLLPLLIPKDEDAERPSKKLRRLDESFTPPPELLTPPPSPNGRHVSFAPAPEVHIKRYTIPPELLTSAKHKYRRGGLRRWGSKFKWLPAPDRFSISPPLGLRFVSLWVKDFLRPMHL